MLIRWQGTAGAAPRLRGRVELLLRMPAEVLLLLRVVVLEGVEALEKFSGRGERGEREEGKRLKKRRRRRRLTHERMKGRNRTASLSLSHTHTHLLRLLLIHHGLRVRARRRVEPSGNVLSGRRRPSSSSVLLLLMRARRRRAGHGISSLRRIRKRRKNDLRPPDIRLL